MPKPAKHDLMRNTNTLSVLNFLRQNKQATRREIQFATGLSWAAVSNITADLIARKIITEQLSTDYTAGRNPSMLDFTPMNNLTIGIDINISGIVAVLLDLRCNIIDQQKTTIAVPEKEFFLEQSLQMVRSLLEAHNLSASNLLGIGISVQGSVDPDGTTSLYNSFIRGWKKIPLKDIFEENFHIPTHVNHDPVCIALAEQWARKLNQNTDVALIRLSSGIVMGYILQGRVIRGKNGTAGELGHIVLNKDGPKCSCGNRGCLESFCSIRGISQRLAALDETTQAADVQDAAGMYQTVLAAAEQARQGNDAVRQVFTEAGEYLGIGIANLVNLFNPELIVLTGELLDVKDMFLDVAKATAQKLAWSLSPVNILLSNNSGVNAAMGAALYYINNAFDCQTSKLLP